MTRQLDPIHPGEILREEFMEPLALSANALALALRVPATRIGEIVRGRRGTSPDLWLGLQAEYDLRVAVRQLGDRVATEVQPRVA